MPFESIEQRLEAAGVVVRDGHAERRLKVIQSTSASQIERYQCPRQWFGGYIEGDWAPSTDAQRRGTAVDLEVQKHYRGEAVHPGWREAVNAIVKLLPAGVVIQHKILAPTYEGGPMLVGYPDFLFEEAPGDVFVDDLKSTSDFRYAKTAEQLRVHIQPVSYSAWLWTIPEVKRVRARHVVAKFDKDAKSPVGYRFRGARLSEAAEMEREHVQAQWGALQDDVRGMVQAAKTVAAFEDLPALGALDVDEFGKTLCERFGGCHYRSRCGLDVLGGRKNMSGTMSLMERLNAAKAAQQNGATASGGAQIIDVGEAMKKPPTDVIPGALTGAGQTVERANPNHAHPGDAGVEGYARGQPCNGKGFYASANGQGFVDVEPGHVCTVCQPGRVLPPDAPSRTSTSAESDEAETKAKKRGRPKKMSDDERLRVFTELNEAKGFTIKEIDALIKEGRHEEAMSGRLTAAAYRNPPKVVEVLKPTKMMTFEINAAPGDPDAIIVRLGVLGFTTEEMMKLDAEGGVEDALAGKLTPGMMRQPAPQMKATPTADPREVWYRTNGSPHCSACCQAQFMTDSGITCKNGHGGASSIDSITAQEKMWLDAQKPTTVVNNYTAGINHAFQEQAAASVAEKLAAATQLPVAFVQATADALTGAARDVADGRVQEQLKALRKAPPKVPAVAPTIYVDCHPVKGAHKASVVDAADWVGPIAELAALAHVDRDSGKAAPLDDVFLAPFGTGRAVLAAALRETLDSCPAVLAVDSSSPAQQIALDVLRPHAAAVVQAKGGR